MRTAAESTLANPWTWYASIGFDVLLAIAIAVYVWRRVRRGRT